MESEHLRVSLIARFITVTAVAFGLVGFPILLVWPRPWARIVPFRWRRHVVARPLLATALTAGPVALVMVAVWSVLIVRASSRATNFGNVAIIVVIVAAIFGLMSAGAVVRAIRTWSIDWCLADPGLLAANAVTDASTVSAGVWRTNSEPITWGLNDGLDQRPVRHRRDRKLRNAGRWLVAAGGCWYVLGRGLQLGSRGNVPDWWWIVTALLATAGALVWAARRRRWHSQSRSNTPRASLAALQAVADSYNLGVHQPAAEWVRSWAPIAFIPRASVIGASQWPWAATGAVGSGNMLVAVQYARMRNRAGLTEMHTRTVCVVRVPHARLPYVTVSEREGVDPRDRRESIPLELEEFNRSLWVSGADARGVYDVIHPRAMALLLRRLPDGAWLRTGGETIAAITDEPVSAEHLRELVDFALASAQLVPTYLINR